MCLITKSHKPIEENISSMSSWVPQPVVWGEASDLVFFLWPWSDSPESASSLFRRFFSSFFFTPTLTIEDLNRLFSDWKRVLGLAFLLTAEEKLRLLGTDPWSVEAQRASCLKVRNLFWTLRKYKMYKNVHLIWQLCHRTSKWIVFTSKTFCCVLLLVTCCL